MEGDKLAANTDLSNQSTWMLLVDQPELEARLLPFTGKKSVPIKVKVSAFGTDVELSLYTSSTVKALVSQIAEIAGFEANKLKIKVVEETLMRRLDL